MEPKVFGGLFIHDDKPIKIPKGSYNPETQLYHNAETGERMFDGASTSKKLTEEELAELLRNGNFVDMGMFLNDEKLKAWCTVSRQTTLSTTSCCPIVTDTSSDTGCDDTPDFPKP